MTTNPPYDLLLRQLEGVLSMSTDPVSNMANISAVLFDALTQVNWVGFYVRRGEELLLGPFQGKPACVRIALGKGVCGTAAQTGQIQRVENVHNFPGHIACDSASQSEIVIPIFKEGRVWGVLDLDSPVLARFTPQDQVFLEKAARLFEQETAL
ncbi:MAG: GAF domain-containing protein [Elusimicrobiaceae bacterium]|nr:GAF domain-containing protein [Elusimicrobiaceae bacterium]